VAEGKGGRARGRGISRAQLASDGGHSCGVRRALGGGAKMSGYGVWARVRSHTPASQRQGDESHGNQRQSSPVHEIDRAVHEVTGRAGGGGGRRVKGPQGPGAWAAWSGRWSGGGPRGPPPAAGPPGTGRCAAAPGPPAHPPAAPPPPRRCAPPLWSWAIADGGVVVWGELRILAEKNYSENRENKKNAMNPATPAWISFGKIRSG